MLTTTAGDLELRIPKLRAGSFFPSLLERRRRIDQALFAVVMEAYLHGVSTRKVDDLVRALGADTGITRARSAGSAPTWTSEVGAFRDRSLAGQPLPLRVPRRHLLQGPGQPPGGVPGGGGGHRGSGDGRREVLGFAVGDSEDGAFWTAFLRSLKARGLAGVQLVIADAHLGPQGGDQRGLLAGADPALPGPLPAQRARPASPRAPPRWSPRPSGPSSPNPTPPTCTTSST